MNIFGSGRKETTSSSSDQRTSSNAKERTSSTNNNSSSSNSNNNAAEKERVVVNMTTAAEKAAHANDPGWLVREASNMYFSKNQFLVNLGLLSAADIKKKIANLEAEIKALDKTKAIYAQKSIISLPHIRYISFKANQYVEDSVYSKSITTVMYGSSDDRDSIFIKKKFNNCPLECSVLSGDFSSIDNLINSDVPQRGEHIRMINQWSYPEMISRNGMQEIQELWFPQGIEVSYVHAIEASQRLSSSNCLQRYSTSYRSTSGKILHVSCIVVDFSIHAPDLIWTKSFLRFRSRYRNALKINKFINNVLNTRRRSKWANELEDNEVKGSPSASARNPVGNRPSSSKRNSNRKSSNFFGFSSSSSSSGPEKEKEKEKESFFFSVFKSMKGDKMGGHNPPPNLSGPTSQWACPICTLLNHQLMVECEGCGKSRNESLNSKIADNDASSSYSSNEGSPKLTLFNPNDNSNSDNKSNNSDGSSLSNNDKSVDIYGSHSEIEGADEKRNTDQYKAQFMFENYRILTKKVYYMATSEPLYNTVFEVLERMVTADKEIDSNGTQESIACCDDSKTTLLGDFEKVLSLKQFKSPEVDAKSKLRDEGILSSCKTKPHFIVDESSNTSGCSRNAFVINVPSYGSLTLYCRYSHPSIKHWAAATLLTYLSPALITKLMTLLLSERSIIISGKSSGLVSTIAIAIRDLISPFKFQGKFIPCLALDDLLKRSDDLVHRFKFTSYNNLFNSLIKQGTQFIVGTIKPVNLSLISNSIAILVVDETFDNALRQGTTAFTSTDSETISAKSVVDLEHKYISWFSRFPPDVTPEMMIDYSVEKTFLTIRRQILRSLLGRLFAQQSKPPSTSTSISTSFLSPMHMFMDSMNRQEQDAVNNFLSVIGKHNKLYFDVIKQRGSTRFYMKKREMVGVTMKFLYQFDPELLLETKRSFLEFQAAVAETQHFMSYFERNKKRDISLENRCRALIYRWMKRRIYLRRSIRGDGKEKKDS